MRLSLGVRDLVLATWSVERESLARALYPGLEVAEVNGEHLVSVAALRYDGGRLGHLPVVRFSQLNVRAYVRYDGEPAVFFLRAYVTPLGIAGAALGAPYRPARLRFRPGRVDGRAVGLSLAYRVGEREQPGELGRHELALFEAAGLRGFRIRRGPAEWWRAEPVEEPRVDLLLALGLDLRAGPSLLYTPETSFETDVPPRGVEPPSSSPSRSTQFSRANSCAGSEGIR